MFCDMCHFKYNIGMSSQFDEALASLPKALKIKEITS